MSVTQRDSQTSEIDSSRREDIEKIAESDLPAADLAEALLEVID